MASDLKTVTIVQAVWPPGFEAATNAGDVVDLPVELADLYVKSGYALEGNQSTGVVQAAIKTRNKKAIAAAEGD